MLGANVMVRVRTPSSSVRSSTTTPTSARASASVAPSSAAPPTCAPTPAARRAWCSATTASWATTPSSAPGQGLPVQDGGARRHHQLLDRLGVAGRPQPVRPRRRHRPGQRRHHPRAGLPGGHGLRHHHEEGRRRSPRRGTRAGRPGPSSGRSWPGSTPPASTSTDLEMAPVPVTRFQVRRSERPRAASPCAWPRRPAVGHPPVLQRRRHRHRRGAQRKIERYFYREDFRRAFAADIGDIGFPARALEYYSRRPAADVDADAIRGRRLPGRPRLRLRLDVAGHGQRAVQAGGRRALGQPVRLHRRRRRLRAQGARRPGRRPGAHVRRPPGRRDRPRRRAAERSSTTRARAHRRAGPAGDGHPGGVGHREGARIALPVSASRAAEDIATDAGAEIVWTKVSSATLMDAAASTEGVALAASQDGGFIFPDFLPAYDATAALVKLLRAAGPVRPAPVQGRRRPAPGPHGPRERRDALGAEGPGHAQGGRAGQGPRGGADRRGQGVPRQRLGPGAPRPREPVTHVWAEGASDAEARHLAQEYARRIRQILR